MIQQWSLRRSVALLLSLVLYKVTSLELQPLRLSSGFDRDLTQKRAMPSALELQSVETFLWGSSAGPTPSILANFTVYMPSDSENIISMEKFSNILKSIACTNTSVTLVFNDKPSLEYARSSWDWVNQAQSRAFIMVAGAQDCHWNAYRQPFNVTDVTYCNDTDTASLTAMPFDWTTIAHSYDFSINHVPSSGSQVQARNSDHEGSVDLTHPFHFSNSFTASNLTTTLACKHCSSMGRINWEFQVSNLAKKQKDASLKLTPSGLGATATLELSESGKLTLPLQTSFPVPSIPLEGVTIPGILDIGPSLDFSVGVDVSAVTGTASITGGANLTVPDSSFVLLDLLHPSKSTFSGWVPNVTPIPISLSAKIEATLSMYAQSALNLDLKVLGHGYGAGLDLKMPNFEATLSAGGSTAGACGTTQAFGVQVNASIGAELSVGVTNGKDEDLFDHVLANTRLPLVGTCFPFGSVKGLSNTVSSTIAGLTITIISSTILSGAVPTVTASSTNSTIVSVSSSTPSLSGAQLRSTPVIGTAYLVSISSIASSATGTVPQPSSTSTAQGSSSTNGTMQYSPRALKSKDTNDAKVMAGFSRHLRSHQLKRH